MNLKIKEENSGWNFANYKTIFISPLLIMGMLMLVYCIKGIYPFGEKNIAYYDMAQNYVPIYYHTYDVLHGYKSCYFDWYSGLGGSMTDIAGNYIFNPINLFFIFVKRNMILESMSFFLLIKLMIAAFTMSFYVAKKMQNQCIQWVIFGGILYASCGYVLQYYTNIHFLDVVMIFPLLMWSYEKMIKQERGIPYTLLMALCFVTNVYMMFMVCIYLILKSLILTWKCDKKNRVIMNVGKFTILAIILSLFCTLPTILQLLHSTRISNTANNNYIGILASVICYMEEQKIFMVYGCEIGIAFLCLIIMRKGKLNEYKKNIIMILFLIIPIVVESVNKLWHTGSYQHFPMRFGYILSFEFICLIIEIIRNEKYLLVINRKISIIAKVMSIAMFPMIVIVLAYFLIGFEEYGIRDLTYYHAYGIIFLLLFLFYIMVLLSSNKKIIFTFAGMMIVCQAFWGYYGFIAPKEECSLECTDDIITKTELLKKNMKIKADPLGKIKNSDTSLNANYPFILEKGAISNWTFGTITSLQGQLKQMGYSTNYTRLLDSGGTVFTDALLGIKNVFTAEKLDERLYSCLGECKEGYYYSCNYQLPFGCILGNDIDSEVEAVSNKFDYQNVLFRNITGICQNLITTYSIDDNIASQKENKDNNIYQYYLRIPVRNESVLYLYALDNCIEKFEFEINGEKKKIPFLSERDNLVYPAAFNNGMVECGVYENEVIELKINVYGGDLKNLVVGSLDLELLEQGINRIEDMVSIKAIAGKNSLDIEGKAEGDGMLFLPMGYNDGWNAKVNGEKEDVIAILEGSFCAVPIQKGEFMIHFSYVPRGIKTGIILSVLAGIIILYMLVNKKQEQKEEKTEIITIGFNVLFYLLAIGIVVFIYVLPIISWIIIKGVELWIFGL